MAKWVGLTIGVVLLGVMAVIGYRLASTRVEKDIYRERLAGLAKDYESLRSMYNQAVRKTAVTELLVRDGRLSLAVRTVEGVDHVIDLPYDPAKEIYCDYVLLDGRLWIRRVYDSATPPSKGTLIDGKLAEVNWSDPSARYGNAVYRSLSEGRWVVTVTGDGSLGLVKADPKADVHLTAAPPVQDYEQIEKQIHDSLTHVGLGDVLKRLFASTD